MIKLSKPYITDQCIDNVVEVLRSGNLVQGRFVARLEDELKSYLGVKYAFAASSGTAALHLALIALGIGPGDEVIVPAFTFPATANVVELVGATTVLVDINLDDYCIDTSKIEQAITTKTKAIMPVHEFGQAAKMDDVVRIAKQYGLHIIEDAACALGTEFESRKVGTFGDFGCFSLHPRKAITCGEGGVVVTNDESLAQKIGMYRNHGIAYDDGKMDFLIAGFNYRLTDFQAALCIPQLVAIGKIIEKRIELAAMYTALLPDMAEKYRVPVTFKNRKMIYQSYHILVDSSIDRDNLIIYLKQNGIETNYGAQALHTLSYFRAKYGYSLEDYPNAVTANRQGLALPLSMDLTKSDIEKVLSFL